MICKFCHEKNEKSKVYVAGTATSLILNRFFFDKKGCFHSRDSSVKTTTFICSNKHMWTDNKSIDLRVDGQEL